MRSIHADIKDRIAKTGLTQERVARAAGIEPTLFSRILRGLRPAPRGFEAQGLSTIDRLEAAERAADEARARVLDDGRAEPYWLPTQTTTLVEE